MRTTAEARTANCLFWSVLAGCYELISQQISTEYEGELSNSFPVTYLMWEVSSLLQAATRQRLAEIECRLPD